MRFFYDSPEAEARAVKFNELYENTVFACALCKSANTVETDKLVPSGHHYKVRCENGHVTNGYSHLTVGKDWLSM